MHPRSLCSQREVWQSYWGVLEPRLLVKGPLPPGIGLPQFPHHTSPWWGAAHREYGLGKNRPDFKVQQLKSIIFPTLQALGDHSHGHSWTIQLPPPHSGCSLLEDHTSYSLWNGQMICFGQWNVNRSEVCHFQTEAFSPSMGFTIVFFFFFPNNQQSP